MAYLFVACPQCRAAYKLRKEHAEVEAVCRSCGHRWVPAQAAKAEPQGPPAEQAAAPPPAPAPPPPPPREEKPSAPPPPNEGSPADALAAMARAVGKEPPAAKPPAATPPAPPQVPPERPAAAAKAPPAVKGQMGSPLDALAAMASGKKAAPAPVPAPAVAEPVRAERTDPLVGTQINGFKIQRRIGSGGFGIVYKAFDTNLERSVAIKMLPPKIAKAGEGIVERFLREARSAAKLAHPNIVTIHQICPHADTYYIVMELVDGGALHEYLAVRKRFAPAEATRVIRAAAEGLGHAHKRGIIHRDIKPGNIMLTNDGQVKVSDFGLARDVLQGHDIIGAGHSLGTPRYMSPEQALGEEPTAASDLYSLAATYFALLTGHAAFDAANDRDIMKMQVQAPVPDPRQYVPELPAAVFRFFERAMAKQPEERYVTAEEFTEALDRLDFSRTDAEGSDSQALINQLGAIAAEDRGAHLSQTLGRAVRRAQRQRTPMPERAVEDMIGATTTAGRKAGWKLWLIIGGVLALLIAGAIVAAVLLAPRGGGPAGTGTEKPAPPDQPPVQPGQPTTPPDQPPDQPPKPPDVKPKPPPRNPLEDVASEVLGEVKAYEADPDTPAYELIRMYQENVINIYPGTQAAKEAQQAIERLKKGGERLGPPSSPPAEKPPETPPPPPADTPPGPQP